jgi:hypothetical protein
VNWKNLVRLGLFVGAFLRHATRGRFTLEWWRESPISGFEALVFFDQEQANVSPLPIVELRAVDWSDE